jgi:hypothetical protein
MVPARPLRGQTIVWLCVVARHWLVSRSSKEASLELDTDHGSGPLRPRGFSVPGGHDPKQPAVEIPLRGPKARIAASPGGRIGVPGVHAVHSRVLGPATQFGVRKVQSLPHWGRTPARRRSMTALGWAALLTRLPAHPAWLRHSSRRRIAHGFELGPAARAATDRRDAYFHEPCRSVGRLRMRVVLDGAPLLE